MKYPIINANVITEEVPAAEAFVVVVTKGKGLVVKGLIVGVVLPV